MRSFSEQFDEVAKPGFNIDRDDISAGDHHIFNAARFKPGNPEPHLLWTG